MSALTFLIVAIIKIAITLGVLLTVVAYTVWLERKVVGRMQNRWGPSRVGPFGLLQPLADGIKFLLKEDLVPPYVEKNIYLLAPALALIMALTSIAMVPIGPIVHLFGISTPVQITGVVDTCWKRQRHQLRDSDRPRNHLAWRLWHCPGGLVIQQQVLAAGIVARLGADG